ncbi:hypothetical protein OIU77_016986 [Salix suchowensis]|uniref:Uncharacterized protein n=1 Tax=Salix suchowensis TaxID=1278906 RepID=A0ABQ8ZMD6_9ROSI|nr:hypothetical protein OIU77_016986 [Salix suchowensis]
MLLWSIVLALPPPLPSLCIVAGEPTQRTQCYQNGQAISLQPNSSFEAITEGLNFLCVLSDVGTEIERQFGNLTMLNLVAGESHACGLTRSGDLVCKGSNGSGTIGWSF